MLKEISVKIGVVPIKRAFLSIENAAAQKERIFSKIRSIKPDEVEFVDIDDVVEKGVLSDNYEDMKNVNAKMEKEKPDAVFMPHCDFGSEEAAWTVAKTLGIPVLLWGEQDKAPEPGKARPTDTQCGLFASSKALQRSGIPFTYIVNSKLDSDTFVNGFTKFMRVASVVKAFKKLRIAQVSLRPKPFMSVMYNEDELLTRFGIDVVPVSSAFITKMVDEYQKSDRVNEVISEFNKRIDCSGTTEEQQKKIAALKLALLDITKQHDCNAIALECWSLFAMHMQFMPCLAAGELSDMGIPVACETDVLGAVTSSILSAAAFGKESIFFADLTMRHPENKNAELLWHCGPFPYSLKDPESTARLINSVENWRLKKGDITIARFDGVQGKYSLFSGEGKAVDGPETTGTYVWFEVDNWDRWEEKLINGPYIHHVACMYGNYSDILNEACKYIPGLNADGVNL